MNNQTRQHILILRKLANFLANSHISVEDAYRTLNNWNANVLQKTKRWCRNGKWQLHVQSWVSRPELKTVRKIDKIIFNYFICTTSHRLHLVSRGIDDSLNGRSQEHAPILTQLTLGMYKFYSNIDYRKPLRAFINLPIDFNLQRWLCTRASNRLFASAALTMFTLWYVQFK